MKKGIATDNVRTIPQQLKNHEARIAALHAWVTRIGNRVGVFEAEDGPSLPPTDPPTPPTPPPAGSVVNANGGVPFRIGDEHDQTIDLGGKTYENAKVGIVIENNEHSERMTIGNGRILNPESNGCYLFDIRDSTVSNLILEGSRDERPLRVPNARNTMFSHVHCISSNGKGAAWFLGSSEISGVTVRYSVFRGGEVRIGIRPQDSHLGGGPVDMLVEDSRFERTSGDHQACIHAWGNSCATLKRCVFKPNGRRLMDIDDTCRTYRFEQCEIEENGSRRPMVEADKARMKGAVCKVEIA